MSSGDVDVLLLCAVQVEWDGLVSCVTDAVEDSALTDPAVRGRLLLGDRALSIALVEVGMGLTPSAMGTLKAVEFYRPALVVFVGVAGGIKDVDLGDVVVADKVYAYDMGKVDAHGFGARSDTRVVPAQLDGMARSLRARGQERSFGLFVGAVASGDKVIANIDSEEIQRVRAHSGDALAIDMESAAVLGAIDRSDVAPDFFVIRGISDLVSNKSESDRAGSQQIAVANAREVALQLVGAWDDRGQHGVPVAEIGLDLAASGLPMPSANERYVVVSPPGSDLARALIGSGLPVSLVVDFDSETDVSGLLSSLKPAIEGFRPVHIGDPTNPPPFGSASTGWVAVRGLAEPILALGTWKRSLRRSWRNLVGSFASAAGGRRTTVLVVDDGLEEWAAWHLTIVDDLLAELGERALIGAIGDGKSVDVDFRINLDAPNLEAALKDFLPPAEAPRSRSVPGDGGFVEIAAADASWIEEDATMFWAAEPDDNGSESAVLDFLRGGEISITALGADADVTRAQGVSIQKQLLGMLNDRRTLRMNLFHAPGAGGSTLARRLGFNIRQQYPVMFLRRYREGETIRRIETVGRASNRATLVFVELPALRDDEIAALVEEAQALSLPAVFVAVSRAYSPPSSQSSSPYLPDLLTDSEAEAFVDVYSARSFAARDELRALASYTDQRRNAFFFGLVAFEDEFLGLDSFVQGRLAGIEGGQRQLILMCSIAHYFGQSAIPEHALARLVGLPASRAGGFARTVDARLRGLLWRSPSGEWRTTHPLIAEEVLRQLGGGSSLWAQALSDWGRLFADFCLDGEPDDAMTKLIESVFIERDDDVAQSGPGRESFARIIDKIPSRDGAAQLLSYLAERLSDDPHVWAHAARYYAYRLKDFRTAEKYAQKASRLASSSSTLHHILGMVYRSRVFDGLGGDLSFDELAPWVENAAHEFSASRELDSGTRDHGFVSEIQMRVRIVEYATRGSSLAEYLARTPHWLVVSSVEKAEDLISTLRYRGDPKRPSSFEQTERAKLKRLYGDYATSLQLLNSLLEKGTVPSPIVRRQLVWTYLARVDREWRALAPKDVDRVLVLLNDNFAEDAYASSDVLAWWRAVRLKAPAVSHERIKEILAYWRSSNPCLEAEYCSFVAYALDALGDLRSSVAEAKKHARRSAEIARNEGTRTRSVDWLGTGEGVSSLVHHSELGKWDTGRDFWADTTRLRMVEGRVESIRGPQTGTARIAGLDAFFVPQRAGVQRGRHENARVRGFLAFTHDGLRLWEPQMVE